MKKERWKRVQDGWMRYWVAWLLGGFVIPELWALIGHRRGDTLSESVWTMTSRHRWTKVPVAGLLVWLFHHFVVDERSKEWA